jgi:hypothetical protein
MKNISLRGLDDELAGRLQEDAKAGGKSVNQLVLETLRRRFGLDKAKRFTQVYHDLDALFGQWSQEEFERIQGGIDKGRRIDPELWQ